MRYTSVYLQPYRTLQELIATICRLAYGTASDHVEEYTRLADATSRKTLRCFCSWFDRRYCAKYPGGWTDEAIRTNMVANEARGFPGMLGLIDCAQWFWKNRPVALQRRCHGPRWPQPQPILSHDYLGTALAMPWGNSSKTSE